MLPAILRYTQLLLDEFGTLLVLLHWILYLEVLLLKDHINLRIIFFSGSFLLHSRKSCQGRILLLLLSYTPTTAPVPLIHSPTRYVPVELVWCCLFPENRSLPLLVSWISTCAACFMKKRWCLACFPKNEWLQRIRPFRCFRKFISVSCFRNFYSSGNTKRLFGKSAQFAK